MSILNNNTMVECIDLGLFAGVQAISKTKRKESTKKDGVDLSKLRKGVKNV